MNVPTIFGITIFCSLLSAAAFADTTANFTLPSGVTVQIVEAAFDKSKFKVVGCSGREPYCQINGRTPFGTDLDLPKTYVKNIWVSFGGAKHRLDAKDMYNAWDGRPLEYKGSIRYFGGKCSDANNCQLRGVFSDAAGSFVAEWQIVNGISTRTVLTSSNDVVHLFMEHIDPPEYE